MTTAPGPRPARASVWWLYGFLVFQFACQTVMILAPVGGASGSAATPGPRTAGPGGGRTGGGTWHSEI
jgi:hypothetical protein